jgi:signal transduction histidine kinase/CheY-like chemotaxis protein
MSPPSPAPSPSAAAAGSAAGSAADANGDALEALLLFLNAAPVGLAQFRTDGTIDLMNGEAARLLMPLASQGRIDNLFTVLGPLAPDLRQRLARNEDAQGLAVDGLRLQWDTAWQPGASPKVLSLSVMRLGRHGLMAMLSDVSAQVRNELALQASEARLRFTLDVTEVGDWSLELATGQLYRSARYDLCFGLAAPQPAWTMADVFTRLHPHDCSEARAGFESALLTHAPWRAECRVIRPDSSVHWLTLHGHVQVEGALAVRMVGVVIDTTVLRQAEAARQQAQRLAAENRQVLEASRLKSEFLAMMSHELRTPLNAVIGFADLLGRGVVPVDSPQHGRYLGHIASSGRHLLQLINDVLDLSKVESGKFEFFPTPVQLPRLVAEAVDSLHAAVHDKALLVQVAIDPAIGELLIDGDRLRQVLYNLLSNAIKFTPAGGRVVVRAQPVGLHRFQLSVEDTGIGIAEADLPRLFVEFQQLEGGAARRHEGTGLGLALTRRLVEAQGGTVGVRSTLGVGSVFHVVLDRRQGASVAPAVHPVADGGDRLLLVQSATAHRAALLGALQRLGFTVDAVDTGQQAVQRHDQSAYGAISLHFDLPDQRGLALLDTLRGRGAQAAVRGLGMAVAGGVGGGADGGQGDGASAMFAVTNVLSKPLRTDEVVTAMARLRLAAPADGGRPTVMVIDDDPRAIDLMRATLASLGADAVGYSDGERALAALAVQPPAALVLDLLLPGLDGFQLLDRLRQLPGCATLPVFIWTSLHLAEADYERLARSARAIFGKGGGGLAAFVEGLRPQPSDTASPATATPS